MKTTKIYNSFTDKFGNKYGFTTYADFAKFWFGMKFCTAKSIFPKFWDLQRAAATSKEARTKLAL